MPTDARSSTAWCQRWSWSAMMMQSARSVRGMASILSLHRHEFPVTFAKRRQGWRNDAPVVQSSPSACGDRRRKLFKCVENARA
jgi:hypothetical protein